MRNFIFPLIIAHSLAVRIAVMFPAYQIFVGGLIVGEFLLLLLLGKLSREWADQQKFYLACCIFGFLMALLMGA